MIEFDPEFSDFIPDFSQTPSKVLAERKRELEQALSNPNHQFSEEDMDGAKRTLKSIGRKGSDAQAYESNWLGMKIELQVIEEELARRS